MPTSNGLFVDTSGWATYFDQDDPLHGAVVDLVSNAIRQDRHLVTADYVIVELVSLFVSRHVRISHARMVAAITLLKYHTAQN